MPSLNTPPGTAALAEALTMSLKSETVAGAGTVITNAAALSAACNLHNVTGADATVGVVLPPTQAGALHVIYSANATNGLKVYPPVNSAINGGSANSEVAIEGKTAALFIGTNATNWLGIYTANS